ncbi:PfkB family carbohydrate kinase [Thiomicrorhabdus lithotrophica]|uniref:PfkB family carbohydrate kinase n=1 Tax=Thiomicrorhabdus lithotrophica TaxID=2949997 RepID=A0ABY8CFS0_9GAMM|nr:PfkB family carbohydrate kinase [Thiomicrorhabdus lithotrophica]WEJ63331.1 PfkB family carbohydrate kinase [Thiomicrorhabdus lithotrophica]
MSKILGIGNAVLDIILTVDHHPKEDEELRAQNKQIETGGNVNNTLYVLNQLGHSTDICTTLAADSEAKQLISGLKARNISTEHTQKFIKGRTPTSFVTLNAQNGHRTIVHYRDLPEISFDFFAKIEIEEYDWLHFEGRNTSQLPGMLNIAKTFLTYQPISLEVEKPREGIEALFSSVNLLIFSHHYAKAKGFKNGQALLESLELPSVNIVCTWGTDGAWLKPINGSIEHIEAEVVNSAIDTLGAGDTFNAALIHSLIEKNTLRDAVIFASELAAKKCRQSGLDNLLTTSENSKPLTNIKQLSNAKTMVVNSDSGQSLVLIKYEDSVRCYVNNCPHQDVPLDEAYKIDVNPFEKTMKCSVHDAYFNIEDGLCIDGPCWDESLQSVPVKIDDSGDIFLA